jgi:hypothetical protein
MYKYLFKEQAMGWLRQWMGIVVLLCCATAFAEQRDLSQELRSYVGKRLILRGYGDLQTVTVKRTNLASPEGACDRAVEILNATQKKNRVEFRLEQIGNINAGVPSHCSHVWLETEFLITDLDDISPQDFSLMFQDVFLTPEAYLAKLGRPFNLQQTDELGPIVMAGKDATYPKPILQVRPTVTEEARKMRIDKSYLLLSAVVGIDGRIHSPQITRNPSYGLDQQSLRVLPLWRFEPARQGDKAVSIQIQLELAFAVY